MSILATVAGIILWSFWCWKQSERSTVIKSDVITIDISSSTRSGVESTSSSEERRHSQHNYNLSNSDLTTPGTSQCLLDWQSERRWHPSEKCPRFSSEKTRSRRPAKSITQIQLSVSSLHRNRHKFQSLAQMHSILKPPDGACLNFRSW